MSRQVTIEELAADLAAILTSVERGERITITRDGECVAEIIPPHERKPLTLSQLAVALSSVPVPGDGYADDLERIQAEQNVAEFPEWPS